MKKFIYIAIAIFCLIGIFKISSAYRVEDNDLTINLNTDTVNINIVAEMYYDKLIMPENKTKVKTEIQNKGIKCFVRFKVEPSDIIEEMNECWILCNDGYYYMNEPLEEYASISLFDKLYFNSAFVHELGEGAEFSVNIFADAIQCDNVEQNLSSDLPWGDVPIEECIRTRLGGIEND